MSAPNRLSAADAIARLGSGALTAEALTRACLERAEEREGVKAWIWLDPAEALTRARAADHAGRPGLLAGLPIGVKDIIDTVDMPTGHGSAPPGRGSSTASCRRIAPTSPRSSAATAPMRRRATMPRNSIAMPRY